MPGGEEPVKIAEIARNRSAIAVSGKSIGHSGDLVIGKRT
jgi:hypothetical protein